MGGILYVAYGGHVGDCSNYHGWVVAINRSSPLAAGWATAGVGEAIWAGGGMASDGTGVFAVTGNRTMGDSSTHADSEEIVRVTGMATVANNSTDVAAQTIGGAWTAAMPISASSIASMWRSPAPRPPPSSWG